ncbi:MAG: DMT family transporter [Bifidobacteriaceae bacterium]|nr:DMT family transporter [Bifidobacteriaceae bacterium]
MKSSRGTQPRKLVGALLLSVAASVWGGMFVVVKAVVDVVPPIQLVWFRYLVAVVVLGAFTLIKRMKWDWNKRDVVLIVLIGVIGNTVSIVTQETGTWLSSAQMGSVITAATPTFMLIFAWWILHERITLGNGVSIALATLGVLLIVGIHLAGRNMAWGSVSLVVAAITWALMSVLIKLVSPRFNAYQIATLAALVAVVCLTPYVVSRPDVLAAIPYSEPRIWGAFLYLGAISTSVAFVMWTRGVQMLGPADSGLYFLFQPVVGTLLGWLVLGEAVSWGFALGTALIAVSIWVSLRFGGVHSAEEERNALSGAKGASLS